MSKVSANKRGHQDWMCWQVGWVLFLWVIEPSWGTRSHSHLASRSCSVWWHVTTCIGKHTLAWFCLGDLALAWLWSWRASSRVQQYQIYQVIWSTALIQSRTDTSRSIRHLVGWMYLTLDCRWLPGVNEPSEVAWYQRVWSRFLPSYFFGSAHRTPCLSL